MSCEQWLLLIEEYVDGELDDAAARRLRDHMVSCKTCAAEYKLLRREQELYQNYVRDAEVSPALWAGVQARIQQDGAGPSLLERLRGLASVFAAGPRLSPVYAMLLVIVAVGVTVFVMRRSGPNPGVNPGPIAIDTQPPGTPAPSPSATTSPNTGPDQPKPAPRQESPRQESPRQEPPRRENLVADGGGAKRPAPKAAPITAEQAIREAEQKYVAAIAILSRDVNTHRSELDPAVAAKFEATLASIDFTIKETKRAVREHPGDPVAAQYMLAAYSEKLDVLREMAGQ